ncbi:hypothetical protein A1F94_006524 [Pyrenophora tritici-repentis]|uniref:Uncharacterized protein n=1 Tax=Pyrenophora tritici-repentis TaxID=45151 RepID=A0A5M9KRI7_9PLEO|nr:hypothetical protein PtrV1_13669 [Pyrenophora tritici-repentis]KAG9382603.1 hypothetical protein A1F94_006524 [Pyrenophora tritici-repentis]KAI0572172.1 hypothetical protein Alg215_09937 [Pyrenophora tritici-repentis]KAI1510226.1 hypothetical protein Ptr86124_010672 [Pyrenophora tritici-repentis]KAI1668603.1 hypothetical protein L13192_07739 [Pyrenophora tritici-repentis]
MDDHDCNDVSKESFLVLVHVTPLVVYTDLILCLQLLQQNTQSTDKVYLYSAKRLHTLLQQFFNSIKTMSNSPDKKMPGRITDPNPTKSLNAEHTLLPDHESSKIEAGFDPKG